MTVIGSFSIIASSRAPRRRARRRRSSAARRRARPCRRPCAPRAARRRSGSTARPRRRAAPTSPRAPSVSASRSSRISISSSLRNLRSRMLRIASACRSVSANSAIITALGSSSVRMISITRSRLRKATRSPRAARAGRRSCRAGARAPEQHLALVVEPGAQHLLQPHDPRRAAVDQHVHVEREADLEVGHAEQPLHQQRRIDGPRPRLEHDAHVLGALVAHVGEDRQLLRRDQLGDLLDQLALLHPVGDLGDDDLPLAAAELLDRPARAQAEAAAPGPVGLRDRWRAARRSRRRSGSPAPGRSRAASRRWRPDA